MLAHSLAGHLIFHSILAYQILKKCCIFCGKKTKRSRFWCDEKKNEARPNSSDYVRWVKHARRFAFAKLMDRYGVCNTVKFLITPKLIFVLFHSLRFVPQWHTKLIWARRWKWLCILLNPRRSRHGPAELKRNLIIKRACVYDNKKVPCYLPRST